MVDTQALADVVAERERQKAVEGWTPEHDDHHADGSLARAAAAYAFVAAVGPNYKQLIQTTRTALTVNVLEFLWPETWAKGWWKPTTPRRNLVKAAALILAEIERLDRASEALSQNGEG